MSKSYLNHIALAASLAVACSCATTSNNPSPRYAAGTGPADQLQLPAPFDTPSARNQSKVIGWPQGRTPKAAPGFEVSLFADKLANPRQTYVLPNKDVLVVESIREWPGRDDRPEKSANRITLFRDTDNDGKPDLRETFLTGLNMPEGMLLLGNWFYVGNTNAVVRYPYRAGQTKIDGKGEKILDLPAGGHHTRTLSADPAGKKIYVAIGSASNVDEENAWEKDQRRAGIIEINPDGSGMRIFARGLRNPVGMDWEPRTKTLWTVVNERDLLGDDLVPDYLTSVKDGAFYGWPYSYFGQIEDPRKKGQRPDLVAKAIKPDYALGLAHRLARLGILQRQSISRTLSRRCLHRHARLVEPLQDGRLQSRVRAIRQRQTRRTHRRYPHRLHRRREQVRSLRPPGRRHRLA